jgi:hypothetical protein
VKEKQCTYHPHTSNHDTIECRSNPKNRSSQQHTEQACEIIIIIIIIIILIIISTITTIIESERIRQASGVLYMQPTRSLCIPMSHQSSIIIVTITVSFIETDGVRRDDSNSLH